MNQREQQLNLNETNQSEQGFLDNNNLSKKCFPELNKKLEKVIQRAIHLINPFITLKMIKNKEKFDYCLGYYLQLVDLNKIIIQSFGLERIFVIPKSYQKAPSQFGTFKIFYLMINLFNNKSHKDENIQLLVENLKKQNKDVEWCWENQGMVLLNDLEQDKVNVDAFIANMKKLFKGKYIEKLKQIFQILCTILRLIQVNDSNQSNTETKAEKDVSQVDQQKEVSQVDQQKEVSQVDQQKEVSQVDQQKDVSQVDQQKEDQGITYSQVFEISTNAPDFDENEEMDQEDYKGSNSKQNSTQRVIPLKDQLQNIFEDLQGGELDEETNSKIQGLFENYQGKATLTRMNSNRIIGYAQFLYSTLIKSFFIDVGETCSSKAKKFSKDKTGDATFFRFSDKIIGGTKAKPYLSNCYLVNFQRDLMSCCLETQSEQSKKDLQLLQENAKELVKKNDQASITKFFKSVKFEGFSNLLVSIGHKSENSITNYTTFYELDDFQQVNKFDIGNDDKKLLTNSSNQYLFQYNNQEKQEEQESQKKQQEQENQKKQEKQPLKEIPSVVSEILKSYENFKKIENKVYIYDICSNDFLTSYINEIKKQQSQDRRIMRLQNNCNSKSHSEGTSPDEAPNQDSQKQQQ